MSQIDDLRDEIRQIDDGILQLLRRRNEAARRIGQFKRAHGLPLQNFEVEKAVLDHALEEARLLGLHEETVRSLVPLLIRAALRVQETDGGGPGRRAGRSALVIGGAGLMGTWFCRFLEESGFEVHVDDPKPSAYPPGKAGARAYDLVLISTPPAAVAEILERVADRIDPRTLLLDISSVKGEAVATLKRLAGSGRRVASLHPMFGPGTELLMGKNVVVLDAGHAQASREAGQLFSHTAARTLPLPLEAHDEYMADVLTLSHATSLAFNDALSKGPRTFAQLEPFSSTTFRKQVEVSREVAKENPRLYFEIQALNPASPGALERLEAAARGLRRIVLGRDAAAFEEYMLAGRRYYGGDVA